MGDTDGSMGPPYQSRKRNGFFKPFKQIGKAAARFSAIITRRPRRRGRAQPLASLTMLNAPLPLFDERQERESFANQSEEQHHNHFPLVLKSKPCQLSLHLHQQGVEQQKLLAVGSRLWGNGSWWDGRSLLKVKVYDFAIYADSQQAQMLRPTSPAATVAVQQMHAVNGLSEQLKKSSDVNMSVMLKASRNLPIHMLSEEMGRILQRRHEMVGGVPNDPALKEVVSYFSAARLPKEVTLGDAVRKGSTITFSRGPNGLLVATAGDLMLGTTKSPKVCEALFDLYLGDVPVSKQAKASVERNLRHLITDSNHLYQPSGGEKLECSSADGSSCLVRVP